MKNFVYTIAVVKTYRANGTDLKRCTLWAIKRNQLHLLGNREYTFESDGQAAVNTAAHLKAIPKSKLQEVPTGGYPTTYALERDGVAKFHQV